MNWNGRADRLLRIATRTFDHGAVTYAPPGGAAVTIPAVFTGDHVAVDLSAGVPVDTTAETLGVRLADFLELVGAPPVQGGLVTVAGVESEVRSVQIDGQGGALLELEAL